MAAGLSFLNENKAADAYAAFRLGLNLSPDDPACHAALARSALLLSAPHLAQYHAQAALAKNAQNLDAIVILAEAARRLGNRDLCQEQMNRFAKIPSVQNMHRSLELNLALEDGEFEVALHGIATLLEDDPEDMMLKSLFNRGFDLFAALPDRPRFDNFMESLGLAVSKEPTTPPPPRAIAPPHCIDVIIPVYNALDDLINCLASIEENRTISLGKIILVDDFSDPATATWLDRVAARNPDIVLVRNLENQGFTRSVMKGMTYSHAAFPVLLNSDTRVTRGWLEGLWKAMNRRPTTALVGPLSDNGYYQTIMANVIASARTLARLGAESKQIDHAASMVLLKTRQIYPRVPLLSGFCLMIRREAYDAVGGFDAEAFPEGYWEVQDLGFKLIDHGLDLVIADDVFVHHSGSASITSERKKRLLHEGRAKMYQRYSALRLLVAEAIAAREPEIAYHRRAWSNYNQFISPPAQAQSKDEPVETRPRRPFRILNQPNPDLRGREVCLFVVHAPMGSASDYTLAYLNAVRTENVYVILCLIVEDLEIPVDPAIYKASDALMMRLNGGYDFAAWADMLVTCPQAWSADRLYFLNDSLTGPFTSLAPIFQKIRAENAGFFALSEAVFPEYHVQSYFFGWNRKNIQSEKLKEFWEFIKIYSDKSETIVSYELGIYKIIFNLPDQTHQVVFGMQSLFGVTADLLPNISPTHHTWRRMLTGGFPFVKTELLRKSELGEASMEGWQKICKQHGADLNEVMRHVELSRLNRLNPEPVKRLKNALALNVNIQPIDKIVTELPTKSLRWVRKRDGDVINAKSGILINRSKTVLAQKTFIVLGAPRGGTSLVAGALRLAGVFMGEKVSASNNEDREFTIHDGNVELFSSDAQKDSFLRTISSIIDRRNDSHFCWGWKDPISALYLFNIIQKVRNPHFVFITRDMSAIAMREKIALPYPLNEVQKPSFYAQKIKMVIDLYQKSQELVDATGAPTLYVSYEKACSNPTDFATSIVDFVHQNGTLETFREDAIKTIASFTRPNSLSARID